MSLPLVSVAIPAFNHAAYIEACLASVCAQTYPELELVLIDDGSTDGTFELARRFLDAHPGRFRRVVLERQKNRGVSATSNACISACRGDWVHLLGSDDVIYPGKVARIQAAIDEWNCSDLALVHADVDLIDSEGRMHARQSRKPRPAAGVERESWRWLFMGEHYIFNPTLALRRDAFLAIGGFDAGLALEDMDFWLRLSVDHAFARVPEVLAGYRKHPGNATRRRVKMLGAHFLTYAKFLDEHGGLLPEALVRRHFRKHLERFWRRTRKRRPWLLLPAAAAFLKSGFTTPRAADYRRFGRILGRMAT